MSYHATAWMHRGQETRRWAFYSIGATMCPIDTGKVHGPRQRPAFRQTGISTWVAGDLDQP